MALKALNLVSLLGLLLWPVVLHQLQFPSGTRSASALGEVCALSCILWADNLVKPIVGTVQ